jgi:hypothetical protein
MVSAGLRLRRRRGRAGSLVAPASSLLAARLVTGSVRALPERGPIGGVRSVAPRLRRRVAGAPLAMLRVRLRMHGPLSRVANSSFDAIANALRVAGAMLGRVVRLRVVVADVVSLVFLVLAFPAAAAVAAAAASVSAAAASVSASTRAASTRAASVAAD